MFQIDGISAVSTMPTPQAAGTPGYFGRGNVEAGDRPTTLTADFMNGVQGELMAILAAGGVAPSKTVFNQVLTALEALFGVAVVHQASGSVTENTISLPGGFVIKFLTGPMPSGSNYNTGLQTFLTPFPNAVLWMGAGQSNAVTASIGSGGTTFHPVTIWFPQSLWTKTGCGVSSDTGQTVDAVSSGLTFSGIAFGN